MLDDLTQILVITGFFCLWLGLFLIALPLVFALLTHPDYWNSLSMSFRDRLAKQGEIQNQIFQSAGKSRLNRAGQFLGATGLSLLMAAGLLWIALRIAQGPAA